MKTEELEKGIRELMIHFYDKAKEWENDNKAKAETFRYSAKKIKDLLIWLGYEP